VTHASVVCLGRDEQVELGEQLTRWATHQSGVLSIDSVTHSREGESESVEIYKVNDRVRYSVQFKPGQSVPDDAQLEFVMLDPYWRIPLVPEPNQPNALSATFNAPDQHGVFTLSLDYRRAGYSFLSHKITVSVAPPRHDQFDRFITGAAPFYLGAGSVVLATISFITIWSST